MSLLARLIEAGTPPDLIEEVAMLLAERRILEKRRQADTARQQAKRERDKEDSHVTSRDVTECHASPSLSRPPNEKNSNPPTHTHPENTPRARKGHRLPIDWGPKPLPKELGEAVVQWPPGAIERELARFRDWAASATGTVAVKSDWDAAWRNWLRKAEDEGRHGRRPQNHSHYRETTRETAMRLAAKLAGTPAAG